GGRGAPRGRASGTRAVTRWPDASRARAHHACGQCASILGIVLQASNLSGRRVSNPRNLLLGKQALYQLSYSRVHWILRGVLLELRPAELLGGSTAVAIGASNVTLSDLALKCGPRDMTDQLRDRSPLLRWIAMVEFKDDRIALAAIGAGMSGEGVVNLFTALLAVDLSLR